MDDDAVPVSADDTEGIEDPVVDEMSAGELALIGIVATAVVAEITGAASEKFTRLAAFRKRIRTYVGGMLRRTRAASDAAMDEARSVGDGSASESLRRTGRAADTSQKGSGRSTSDSGDSPDTSQIGAGSRRSGRPAPTQPIVDLDAPATPGRQRAREPQHRAPNFPADMTLDDLRATAPIGPQTPRGVTIRPPNPLLPQLEAMAPHMVAAAEGMYQEVMAEVLANPLASEADRLRLAQKLINRYAARGITGYVDSRGRNWSMTSYIEMATRTATAQAAIDAHVALIAEHGYDLVRVSVHANCSPMCKPFQGNLLSVTGATTSYGGTESWRGRVITSVAKARARGLHHPNCRHSLSIYVPGDPLPAAPVVDPDDYKASQRLRYLERQVRASKRLRAAALTPAAAQKANARTRAMQAKIREHVDAHPTVPRLRRREQIDTAR